MTVRSRSVVGPDKKVKLTLTYPASYGAVTSMKSLGSVDSSSYSKFQVAHRPIGKDGDDCIVLNSVPDSDLEAKFPKGVNKVKPYLRVYASAQ